LLPRCGLVTPVDLGISARLIGSRYALGIAGDCDDPHYIVVEVWILPLETSDIRYFFFSSRRRHTRLVSDWSSDVCSSDLETRGQAGRSAPDNHHLDPSKPTGRSLPAARSFTAQRRASSSAGGRENRREQSLVRAEFYKSEERRVGEKGGWSRWGVYEYNVN